MSNKQDPNKMLVLFGMALYNILENREGIFLEYENEKYEVYKDDKQMMVGAATNRPNFSHGQMFFLIDSENEVN